MALAAERKLRSFNPLPSHEGRRSPCSEAAAHSAFNPLPSHEGRPPVRLASKPRMVFQSTSLSRGKTVVSSERDTVSSLSIHFPLTREDAPISPSIPLCRSFQSTSLSRGKTKAVCAVSDKLYLSIHFPLTREDFRHIHSPSENGIFQSTSLSRGKTSIIATIASTHPFQSTSLSRGKT